MIRARGDMTPSTESVKKTRRRLRVSCVECTRRRQKCDREQPCGLCRSRAVEHLCRWELEPFARPAPSRPPISQRSEGSGRRANDTGKVREIASVPLEDMYRQALESTRAGSSGDTNMSSSVDHEVKEAAIALAQLSVARHGEYLGTGSLVCALHKLDHESSTVPIPTDKSSGLPFFSGSQYSTVISSTFSSSLMGLISSFPDRQRCDALITAFFEHENWSFGLPRALILTVYSGMWETIRADSTSVQRINFHWVTLLFTIFALSPNCFSEEESRKYFLQALTGRRLAEDVLMASFFVPRKPGAFSQGAAYGCIATSLMAQYMCDRGQMTEAWKLIGSALRSAQNSGLHLNPAWKKWQDVTKDEQDLRCLAWHSCAIKDRILSFALGRPGIVRSCDFYVPLRKHFPTSLAADGSTEILPVYWTSLFCLLDVVGEAKDKYLCVHPEYSDAVTSFDAAMRKWEASLPKYFACHDPDTTLDHVYSKLSTQRSTLMIHYFAFSMLFCRSLALVCAEDVSTPQKRMTTTTHVDINTWEFKKMVDDALSLLRAERTLLSNLGWVRQVCFTVSYFIFEAAVTLSLAILFDSGNPQRENWIKGRDDAVEMLQTVLDRDNGDISRQAILVIRILQDSKSGAGDLVSDAGNVSMADLFPPQGLNPSFSPIFDANRTPTLVPELLDFSLGDRLPGSVSTFDLLFNLDTTLFQ